MFSKDKKNKSSVDSHFFEKNNIKTTPSIISEDLIISGDLIGDGEIQVDGKIEGDVRCRTLIIGVSGVIIGSINVDEVRVFGCITGQLVAKSVFFASTARMNGDVTHDSLAVEPGAYIEGHCRRISDPIPAEQGTSDLMITDARIRRKNNKNKRIRLKSTDEEKTNDDLE